MIYFVKVIVFLAQTGMRPEDALKLKMAVAIEKTVLILVFCYIFQSTKF